MPDTPQTALQKAAGLAYSLLFAQQAVFDPNLTPDQFKAWLYATVAKKLAEAKKGK